MAIKDPMQEVLAAIGAWTMHNCQGKPEMANEIFRCVVPKFQDRYPHHKLLAHLCQDARDPLLLLLPPDAALLTVYIVAYRLSVKLPTGEVLFDPDARTLAEMLFAHGFGPDDVNCADWREGDRSPTAGQAVALKSRLRELSNAKIGDL